MDKETKAAYMRQYRASKESLLNRWKDAAHTTFCNNNKRVKDAGFNALIATDPEEVKKIKHLHRLVAELNHVFGRTQYSVDHITPISMGGSNTLDNLQILSISENLSKHYADMKRYGYTKRTK